MDTFVHPDFKGLPHLKKVFVLHSKTEKALTKDEYQILIDEIKIWVVFMSTPLMKIL